MAVLLAVALYFSSELQFMQSTDGTQVALIVVSISKVSSWLGLPIWTLTIHVWLV